MRMRLSVIVVIAACSGCSRSAPEKAIEPSAPQAKVAPIQAPVPVETSRELPPAVYPENDSVVRILFQARELYQKSKFEAALELVTRALDIDPQSPSARDLHHDIVEAMKRIDSQKQKRVS